MIRAIALMAVAVCMGTMAAAFDLALPDHTRTVTDRVVPFGSYRLPVGSWREAAVPHTSVEGRVRKRSFRIDGESATSLQILDPIRDRLKDQGFDILFECETSGCGGFDFRFGIDVLPAPEMYVNLRDFRFLSARRGKTEAAGVLVSGSPEAMYMQVVTITPPNAGAPQPAMNKAPPARPAVRPFDARLVASGFAALDGLLFGSGAAAPLDQDGDSLGALAEFLANHPAARILLVGHADATEEIGQQGADLARDRAAAVRDLLGDVHDVSPDRLDIAGAGLLAPVASNLTEDGRRRNRRVVVVLLEME